MYSALRSEVLSETDQGKEPCANPSIATVIEEFCPTEQAEPPRPVVPIVPDERALETFVDGAGI
jgi:hypothetical protein